MSGALKIVKLLDPISIVNVIGGMTPKGEYNPATNYEVGDSVEYEGSSYLMYADAAAGTLPTNATYWQILAEKGDTGDAGPAGANGTNGTDGEDGKTVLNGTGAPANSLGTDGDFYIDTTADAIYGPKAGGTWGSGTSLVGPQGPQGDPGTPAPDDAAGISYDNATSGYTATDVQAAIDEAAGNIDDKANTADLAAVALSGEINDLVDVDAAAPTDGQVIAWSNSLQQWVAVNPTGITEIAAAQNITGTTTQASANGGVGAAVVIPGTSISVTNSNGRPVNIQYGAAMAQNAAGKGTAYLVLQETTSGVVTKQSAIELLPNVALSVSPAEASFTLFNQFPIGAVTTTRTFRLAVLLYAPASNAPSAYAQNIANYPSFIRAVAG